MMELVYIQIVKQNGYLVSFRKNYSPKSRNKCLNIMLTLFIGFFKQKEGIKNAKTTLEGVV